MDMTLNTSKIIVIVSEVPTVRDGVQVEFKANGGEELRTGEVRLVVSRLIENNLRLIHSTFQMVIPEDSTVDWEAVTKFINEEL